MKLYQIFDELQGHESIVAQTIRELFVGPVALVSSFESTIPSSSTSDPIKPIVPSVQTSAPTLPTQIYPVDDSEAIESELCFQ